MNQKQAKLCRLLVRLDGQDWREAVEQPKKPVFDFRTGAITFSGQVVLEPSCGRAQYQQLKRDYVRSSH